MDKKIILNLKKKSEMEKLSPKSTSKMSPKLKN